MIFRYIFHIFVVCPENYERIRFHKSLRPMVKSILKRDKKTYKKKFFLSDNESVKTIYVRFNARYPGFIPALRKSIPGITRKETELCILIVLNQSTKEIARRMEILPASVNMNRHRLRRKLKISTAESLREVIVALFEILN